MKKVLVREIKNRWKQFLQNPILKTFLERYLFESDPLRALNYLLAPSMVALISNGIWIMGIVVLVFWPQKEQHVYLFKNDIPINFLIVFEVLLLGSAYVNLLCGRGEMMIEDSMYYHRTPIVTIEESRDFLTYGLPKLSIQTLILLMPFFPFLMISAILSQISGLSVIKGIVVIYSFSLFCRLIGFITYLTLGKDLKGHYSCRVLLLAFLGITFYYTPWINPLLSIYDLHQQANELVTTSLNSYTVYLIGIISMILLLALILQLMIRRKLLRELAS